MSGAGWPQVLAELEADVARAEDVLRAGPAVDATTPPAWQAPEGLGPLPTELRERAVALLERQRRVEQQMRHALDDAAQRRARVDSLGSAYAASRTPLYVDVAV